MRKPQLKTFYSDSGEVIESTMLQFCKQFDVTRENLYKTAGSLGTDGSKWRLNALPEDNRRTLYIGWKPGVDHQGVKYFEQMSPLAEAYYSIHISDEDKAAMESRYRIVYGDVREDPYAPKVEPFSVPVGNVSQWMKSQNAEVMIQLCNDVGLERLVKVSYIAAGRKHGMYTPVRVTTPQQTSISTHELELTDEETAMVHNLNTSYALDYVRELKITKANGTRNAKRSAAKNAMGIYLRGGFPIMPDWALDYLQAEDIAIIKAKQLTD